MQILIWGGLLCNALPTIVCPPGTRKVDSTCIPESCVTEYPDGTLGECGDAGLCVLTAYGAYDCSCISGCTAIDFVCYSQDCLTGGDPSNICSGHGFCRAGLCECDPRYYGVSCEHIKPVCDEGTLFAQDGCHPRNCVSNEQLCSSVDSSLGRCLLQPVPHCHCSPQAALLESELCYPLTCIRNGIPCLNGRCTKQIVDDVATYSCVCDKGFQLVENRCVASECVIEVRSSLLTECSGNGVCTYDAGRSAHFCACHAPYKGIYCDACSEASIYMSSRDRCIPKSCISYPVNSSTPLECSNYGSCFMVSGDSDGPELYACTCTEDLPINTASMCYSTACITDAELNEVCGNHGVCIAGACVCVSGWTGPLCTELAQNI